MLRSPLTPRSALGGDAPGVDTVGAFRLEERPDVAIASVAARTGRGEETAARLGALVGQAPGVGALAQGEALEAFWVGPGQWFVLADHGADALVAARLKAQVGDAASITEQNDGWVCLELSGEGLGAVLERLTNVDIARIGAGAAIRTTIEHIGCFLLVDAPGARYRLLSARSFARSLRHALTTAMWSVDALRAVSGGA